MSERKIDRIKKHLKDHKEAYIVGGVMLIAGVVIGVVFKSSPTAVQKANIQGLVNWKPVQTLEQTTVLVRRGHPGYIVKCLETGELFASQRRASDLLNLNLSDLSKHLNGGLESVKGLHFERLGEAAA